LRGTIFLTILFALILPGYVLLQPTEPFSAVPTTGATRITAPAPPAVNPPPSEARPGLVAPTPGKPEGPTGVCPPFKLRDEQGRIIDPVHGVNDKGPYSSKQTCGACHNYQLITEGFHFTPLYPGQGGGSAQRICGPL
jgi:hypothetical protein